MAAITKPLLSLTADDLMTRTVVMIPCAMSLQRAAHLLGQAGITGAPIVDADGCCVGVISASDFVAWADKGEAAARKPAKNGCCAAHHAWQMPAEGELPRQEVGSYMTPDPVMVAPATPIGELARMMVDAHIHRVVVVNAHKRPVGIVSSTDVLAALARQRPEEKRSRSWSMGQTSAGGSRR